MFRTDVLPATCQPAVRTQAQVSAYATTDLDLIAAIARGDRNAMRTLYGRHNVKVFRFVLRMVRNEATAEELVSDVFLDVWRVADRFEGRSQVSTWILAIARNKAITSLRARTTAELDDEATNAIVDDSEGQDVALENKDRNALLRECLTSLTAAHREIIDLVYFHEKTVEEIAEIMSIPANTVKTRMFYARKHLGELLAQKGMTSLHG
jgi:RNA polymerase sigma-70 factor (ECF subfamily)